MYLFSLLYGLIKDFVDIIRPGQTRGAIVYLKNLDAPSPISEITLNPATLRFLTTSQADCFLRPQMLGIERRGILAS